MPATTKAMQIDIPTLYVLTIGTLCVAVAMTLWERRAHPLRARELSVWVSAYAVFAFGCAAMAHRSEFPGILGSALSNLLFVVGYSLILWGVARFDRRRPPLWPYAVLLLVGLAWPIFGAAYPLVFWNHLASLPIAVICCATGLAIWRSPTARPLRSRPVAAAISMGHGLFYLARAVLVPCLVALDGEEWLHRAAVATMFEAVLYSVAMPMAFLALVREEAQRDLMTVSRTDHLTGLGNRHALFEEAEAVLASGGRRRAVSLLAFDLDHFKAINDRHGHAFGDEVLRLFAAVARSEVGMEAPLARLGGEEFAALLPGCGTDGARRIGERVCRRFTEEAARWDGLAIQASVSIGVAERRDPHDDLSALLLAADRALYRAKRLGRNRVETAAPEAGRVEFIRSKLA